MAERGAYGSGQPKAKCMQHIAIDSGFSQPLVLECDDEQRMEPLQFLGFLEPSDKLGHQPGGVKGLGDLVDDGNLLAGVVEGGNTVGQLLVLAAAPVVILAVAQEIVVELLDVVLRDRDLRPRMEDGLHDFGVTGDLLLVAGGKGFDLQIGEQALHVAVGKLAAFDARRGADALNGRHAAQGAQTCWRKGSGRTPCPFELIDLSDEREHFGGDRDVAGLKHLAITPIYTPIISPKILAHKVFKAVGGARSSLARSGNSSMGGKTAKSRHLASFQC